MARLACAHYAARDWRWALTVFFINMATVIGPTPPGTGVIRLAIGATDGK
jgi:hypothetical protein